MTGSSIGNDFRRGANTGSLSRETGKALELAVYTVVLDQAPFVEGGIPVPLSWRHIPDGAYVGYQFRALFVTHHAIKGAEDDIEVYNAHVQFEAKGKSRRYPEASGRYNDPVIRRVAGQFKAVVCTAAVDARTNTGMEGGGVPVHWLDGGFEDHPTLVANSNAGFYGPTWLQDEWGAYVTGNSRSLYEISSHRANEGDKIITGVWTGCDSTGMAHSDYHLGSTMGMATLGTPGDENQNAPIGPTDSSTGMVAIETDENRPIYAISPIFTVVGGEHSILPPRNVRGEVDETTRALTLSWDPPRGYEEDNLFYQIWWRNPSTDSTWDPVQIEGALLTPSAPFDVALTRNTGYDIDHGGSLSETTFEHDNVTYTVWTLLSQLHTNKSDPPDLFIEVTPQPDTDAVAEVILTFENGDSVALADATEQKIADDAANGVPAYSRFRWAKEGISFKPGAPVVFSFYDDEGNSLIDSLTDVVVDGTTWTDDRSDRRYGVQARDAEGRTSTRVRYECSELNGCVIPEGGN